MAKKTTEENEDIGIFNKLLKTTENEFVTRADDDIFVQPERYNDTGSLSFNALVGGSIFTGFPGDQIIGLAGEPATGKTFYAIQACETFLKEHPKGLVFYFESENAKKMIIKQIEARGIDKTRFALIPVITVQEFRTQIVRILNAYLELKESQKVPMFFVLDSLGNLSTTKEVEDIENAKETRDMTRAQLIRGTFRVLNHKLGRAKADMIVTNHVYDAVGAYVPTKKMGGGDGLPYAASTIIFLLKTKDRDDDEVNGAIIKCIVKKGRLTVENREVKTRLLYDKGLDRYYGLVDLAIKFGIIKKLDNKIALPDGSTHFRKHIENNPEKYFSEELLEAIDNKCKQYFLYNGNKNIEVLEDEED